MEKKETKIATNVSSGAEKVEAVEKEVKKEQKGGTKTAVKRVKTATAKGDAALGDSAKKTEKTTVKETAPAEKEGEAAKKRVELALKKKKNDAERKEQREKRAAERKAKKEKRLAERKARLEKKLAEKKERAEKRAAERKAAAEKRAAEKEAALREHAHQKANKRQTAVKKKKEKSKRKNRPERESREKGYGGWIAAVVALGVTTLALATTVAVGGVEMNGMQEGMMASRRSTVYELTGIMEHVDDDLDRIRVSQSPVQQSRILTDLLVQARLAEADLEKLPVAMEKSRNVTEFINRTASECERMLAKLRRGEPLSEGDLATLEGLYKTNHSIRGELDKLVSEMTDKDLMSYLKEGTGMISDVMDRLENATLEENRAALERKMEEIKGAGMERTQEKPSEPTASTDTAKAEELCKTYFAKYKINEYQCVGETVNRSYSAYNVQGFDEKGSMLFAEIDKNSGALLRFDYFEECSAENFDTDNAKRIAEEFLTSLGYEDMTVARWNGNGSTDEFTFVYEEDGVAYSPDEIRVKVCRTRGVVSGMDATKYLKNHRGRDEVNVKLTLEEASLKLSEKLSVEASKLAVVKTARGERPAYEFLCSYDGENYFVYIDANTGDEIAIMNVMNVR